MKISHFIYSSALFQEQNIRNVYVVPSHASAFSKLLDWPVDHLDLTIFYYYYHLLEWFGVVFIHDGLYAGAIFRFTLLISPNYPIRDTPVSN